MIESLYSWTKKKMFLHMCLGDMLTFIKSYFKKKIRRNSYCNIPGSQDEKTEVGREGVGRERNPMWLNFNKELFFPLNDWWLSFRFIRGTYLGDGAPSGVLLSPLRKAF